MEKLIHIKCGDEIKFKYNSIRIIRYIPPRLLEVEGLINSTNKASYYSRRFGLDVFYLSLSILSEEEPKICYINPNGSYDYHTEEDRQTGVSYTYQKSIEGKHYKVVIPTEYYETGIYFLVPATFSPSNKLKTVQDFLPHGIPVKADPEILNRRELSKLANTVVDTAGLKVIFESCSIEGQISSSLKLTKKNIKDLLVDPNKKMDLSVYINNIWAVVPLRHFKI